MNRYKLHEPFPKRKYIEHGTILRLNALGKAQTNRLSDKVTVLDVIDSEDPNQRYISGWVTEDGEDLKALVRFEDLRFYDYE